MADETYEPTLNERGAVRLDRKLGPQEAAEQDEAHRQTIADNRARRFHAGGKPRSVRTIERELKAALERTGEDTREEIARLRQELEAATPEAA